MPACRYMHFGALESALDGIVNVWSEMCGISMLEVQISDVNRCVFSEDVMIILNYYFIVKFIR